MLAVNDVCAAYGAVQVLFGVSLQVAPATCVAVLGANGAGKTTLLRTISGFLAPTSGSITLEGSSIGGRPPHEIVRLGVSQVLQGRQVLGPMSVLDNLRLGGHVHAARHDRQGQLMLDEIYQLFPILAERSRALGGSLSGGEQQMLAIGRALMSRPRVLLLDEPSMGLAPLVVKQISEALLRIKSSGIAMLLVEPNPDLALAVADRCCLVDRGRVVLEDSAENMKARGDLGKLYLGGDIDPESK